MPQFASADVRRRQMNGKVHFAHQLRHDGASTAPNLRRCDHLWTSSVLETPSPRDGAVQEVDGDQRLPMRLETLEIFCSQRCLSSSHSSVI